MSKDKAFAFPLQDHYNHQELIKSFENNNFPYFLNGGRKNQQNQGFLLCTTYEVFLDTDWKTNT